MKVRCYIKRIKVFTIIYNNFLSHEILIVESTMVNYNKVLVGVWGKFNTFTKGKKCSSIVLLLL